MSLDMEVDYQLDSMSSDAKADYQPNEEILAINTIIIEQEISAAWKSLPLKWFRNILGSSTVFMPCTLFAMSKIIIFLAFFTVYAVNFGENYKVSGITFSLILLFITALSVFHTWFKYRYSNIFHRMGINPKSKNEEDLKEIFNIFLVLFNNNIIEISYDNKKLLLEKLMEKIAEKSFFARSPVIDFYREKMEEIATNYDNKLEYKKEKEKQKNNTMLKKIKDFLPGPIENKSLDNETSKKLLLNALQHMNKND